MYVSKQLISSYFTSTFKLNVKLLNSFKHLKECRKRKEMRTTSCAVQQAALTAEALSMVKQAIALARCRGHVQVTPLHVANTMLTAATGLLRTACHQSRAHPLQCKALELCFNVALNRLPASSSGHMLGGSSSLHHPSVSNALVAAFKRAQAHQRRGSIENQQQPILSVKIEVEQLIISILDDPSVSRVMKEAGFSSTQVKTNVEKAVSFEISSQSIPSSKSKEVTPLAVLSGPSTIITQLEERRKDPVKNEDVKVVIDNLINKKSRSLVFVGEPVSSVEDVIQAAIEKVESREVPEVLREVKFINLSLSIKLSLSSIKHLFRAEVEQKLVELTNLVRSCLEKGVVLYLGDLKWAIMDRTIEQGRGFYSPLEHMIMELGKLVYGVRENERFWLVGIATFQTYIKCKTGYSSPGTVWGLNPVMIPAGSLRLSLSPVSDPEIHYLTEKAHTENGEEDNQLPSCKELSAKFAMEDGGRSLQTTGCNSASTTSSLPAWLQPYKSERKRLKANQNCAPFSDIGRNNSITNSTDCLYPTSYERSPDFASSTLISSTVSGFSHAQQSINAWPLNEAKEACQRHCWTSEAKDEAIAPNLKIYLPGNLKQLFPSNSQDSIQSPASSSDIMETEDTHKFKELNSDNLVTLRNALEKKVPWQKDVIPEIAKTRLQCRSGRIRRKGKTKNGDQIKEETWLFFQDLDSEGKEKSAKEIARLVFGSQSENFVSIALSSFSTTTADATDNNYRHKRSRDDQSGSYIEQIAEAVLRNPHRGFLVEDVEQADYCSQMRFKRAIEGGKITISNGEELSLDDPIVILGCETFSSRSRACSPPVRHKREESTAMDETRSTPCLNLDLNISINDDDNESAENCDCSIDDIGLLESVDRRFLSKIKEV